MRCTAPARSAGGPVGTRHLHDPARCRVSARTSEARILGRFLEQAGSLFANDGSPVGIGSADLTATSTAWKCLSPSPIQHVGEIEALFDMVFDDRTASWHLQPDGT